MAMYIAGNGGKGEGGSGAGCSRISFLLPAIVVIGTLFFLLAGGAHAEHDIQTFTFEFSGSGTFDDLQEFIIHNDGALYVKLKSYTPSSPTSNKPIIGFRKPDQFLCPARYDSYIDDPTVGTSYGPFYMEAETYLSYFYLNPGVSSYALEIEYRRQLIANDKEPNDTSAEAEDIGNLPAAAQITGHLGYLGCVHDKKDYRRFGVTATGDYLFDFQFDSPFREKAECKLYFHLLDETTSTWLLSYTGPANGNDLGPKRLEAGHTYLMSMEASGCYETISEGGGTFVVGNKAGAYEVTLTNQQTPPADPPFTVTSVAIVPSLLYWGKDDADLIAIIENKGGNPISNVAVEIRVERSSNNELIAQKTLVVPLTPYQQRQLNFTMIELLGGQSNINRLREDTYKVTVVARQSQLGHESTAAGTFDFTKDLARIVAAITAANYKLRKKKAAAPGNATAPN